jgi:hypothetical protein
MRRIWLSRSSTNAIRKTKKKPDTTAKALSTAQSILAARSCTTLIF